MSCQVKFPLQDIVLLLREKINPEVIGAVSEEKLEEEVLAFIQPKIDELQGQLSNLPDEVHIVSQNLDGSILETTLSNGEVYQTDLEPLLTRFDGLFSLYEKNVAAGAGANGWSAELVDYNGETQKQVNDYVYPKIKRENVSVWDFFTEDERVAYDANPTKFDAYRPLQAFFDYVTDNNVGTAYCSAEFYISKTTKLGNNGLCKTKNFIGDLSLTALNGIDTMLQISAAHISWAGLIRVTGVGIATNTASKTCRIGVSLSANADRSQFDGFIASLFSQTGVSLASKSTLIKIGIIRALDCGSGYTTSTMLSSTWGNRADSGSANSFSQRSTITVDTMPNAAQDTPMLVIINDNPYYVVSTDETNKTLTLFPWVDTTITSGTLYYGYGGAVSLNGGDASVVGISAIDAMRCFAGAQLGMLYAPVIERLTAQYCYSGLVLGLRHDASFVGGHIDLLYVEACPMQIIKLTRAVDNFSIASQCGVDLAKVFVCCAPRDNSNVISGAYANLLGISLLKGAMPQLYSKPKSDGIERASKIYCNIFESYNYCKSYKRNNAVIDLAVPDVGANNLFGYDSGILVIVGDGTNGAPTGTVTFNAPSGTTVNGNTALVLSNFKSIAVFYIYFDFLTNKYLINTNSTVLLATTVYDPPSLVTATQQSTTVALVGAKLGDTIAVSFNKALNGTRLWAEVTATDTVTVYHRNDTGTTVDLPSGTLTIKIV